MEYALKAVSAYLGVPPDTVRKWEARYSGLVRSERASNGYRRYSEADLRRLLAFTRGRRAGLPGAQAARRAASAAAADAGPDRALAKAAMKAFERFDRAEALRVYRASVRGRSVREAFGRVWLPVMTELGERAHGGPALWIAVEHFASGFLRERVLCDLAAGAGSSGPRLALAAPEGERHGLGLLLAACALEEAGVRCVSLGADLPQASLEAALERLRPAGLSLTLTMPRSRASLKALLERLRRRFPAMALFFCGRESLRHANLIRESGVVFIGTDLERGAALIGERLRGEGR